MSCALNEIFFEAVLDTGAPYNILHPTLYDLLRSPVDQTRLELIIRGDCWVGPVVRQQFRLVADEGHDVEVEGSFFVPRAVLFEGREYQEDWNEPNFIGLTGTLERIRFAVDSTTNQWYFSPL